MVAAGKPEDEIVAVLEARARQPGGKAPPELGGGRSRLREMIQGAQEVLPSAGWSTWPRPAARNTATTPRKRIRPPPSAPDPQVAASPSRPGAAADHVDGELWTYAAGLEQVRPSTACGSRSKAARYVKSSPPPRSTVPIAGSTRAALVRGCGLGPGRRDRRHNGALDMETGAIVPHSPGALRHPPRGCAIDPAAECPVWQGFLRHSLPDGAADAAGMVRRGAGARQDKGDDQGPDRLRPVRTGKTQITEVLRALLGGNTCGLSPGHVRAVRHAAPDRCAGWIADDASARGRHGRRGL